MTIQHFDTQKYGINLRYNLAYKVNKSKIYILKGTIFSWIKERLLSSKNINETIDLIDLVNTKLAKVIGINSPETLLCSIWCS